MPASATLGEDASDFQYNFLKSGGLPLVLSMLTRNNFLPSADMETRRGAYLNALKIAKLLLTAVGFGHVKAVAEACQPSADGNIPVSPVRQLVYLAYITYSFMITFSIIDIFIIDMLSSVSTTIASLTFCTDKSSHS